MKRILAIGLVCAMVLCLCACGKGGDIDDHTHETIGTTTTTASSATATTGGANGNDVIRFNKPKDTTHVGRVLADPTTVSKEDFAAAYDVRWAGMLDGDGYQTEYSLYYYTADATASMGLSGLCHGLIRVTKDEALAMVMYVSTDGYAGDVAYPDADMAPSRISNTQVYLVDATGIKNQFMYAQFRWGRYYVTCKLYDCEKDDLVNFVRSVLANTPRK